jgi:hypothetical protein
MNETSPKGETEPKTPSQEIADTLAGTYGEEAGFDEETLEEIATQPFEEAFETAYSYLTQAGLDADIVLAPWMEQTE